MNPIVQYLAGLFIYLIARMIVFTCRVQYYGVEKFEEEHRKNNGKILSVSWHRSMLFTVYFFSKYRAAIMTSRSKDGDLIAAVLRRFKIYAPRGSSGKDKGGATALNELAQYVLKGNVGGLAADAPKGPAFYTKKGIITLAAKAETPIMVHMWAASKCWRINSWDRTIIPKPFSKVVFVFERDAFIVPKKGTKPERQASMQELDDRLNSLMYQVDHWFSAEHNCSDPREIPVPDPVPRPDYSKGR